MRKKQNKNISIKQREDFVLATEWQLIKWKFLRHKLAVVSLAFIIILYMLLIFAEFFAPYNPNEYVSDKVYVPPQRIRFVDQETKEFSFRPFIYKLDKGYDPITWMEEYTEDRTQKQYLGLFVKSTPYKMRGLIKGDVHFFGIKDNPKAKYYLLGSDSLGRDVLSRLIFGARISLTIGFLGMALTIIPSIFLGGLAGLFGGWVDKLLMRINETIGAIPTLPLWLALTAILPTRISTLRTYFYMTLILAGVGLLSGGSRTIRSKFMAIKTEDYVTAARLDNANSARLIFKYMLPSFTSHIIADLTLSIPGMILGETALSFLGLGMQEPAISWGVMLQECRVINNLINAPWLFSSAIILFVAVLSFNFIGDGLRDAVDPYSRI